MGKRIAIIGAGFYGLMLALEAKRLCPDATIQVFESGSQPMQRASRVNQARVHAGYHYPRSLQTAFRSQANYHKFIGLFEDAIDSDFKHVYGIASESSKTTFGQFVRFCSEIGAKADVIDEERRPFATSELVEGLIEVDEVAFDFQKINKRLSHLCLEAGVQVLLDTPVLGVEQIDGTTRLRLQAGFTQPFDFVFNTTYATVGQFGEAWLPNSTSVKLELTEMCLVRVPDSLRKIGITIMDGPFFSLMPYPSSDLHSFSHVRFTPIESTLDVAKGVKPISELTHTMFNRMKLDAERYIPALSALEYVSSIVEVKAVLTGNEIDDGRPILYYENREIKSCFSVLGGKLDNIFDVFHELEKTLVG